MGEIVAVDAQGIPRFQMLQHRSTTDRSRVVFYAFDLLHIDGEDLQARPLQARRARLEPLIVGSGVLFSEELTGDVETIVEAARSLELEGIVAKRRDSTYEAGRRSGAWQKLKLRQSQEFVVGGYSPGEPFDGIIVGYYDAKSLLFCGKVRAGFTPASRRDLFRRLDGLQIDACPFANLPSRKSGGWGEGIPPEDMPKMRWVRPSIVVQVAFLEWTSYDMLRHASFVGIRDDQRPADVVRETFG